MKSTLTTFMRMHFVLYIGILSIVLGGAFQDTTLSAQTGASGSAQPYEFKFARLGMSLEEFKKATARGDVTLWVPGRFGPRTIILSPIDRLEPGDVAKDSRTRPQVA